eukprot:scaffold226701_cov31-Tisochrysis_lutea.AAC.5
MTVRLARRAPPRAASHRRIMRQRGAALCPLLHRARPPPREPGKLSPPKKTTCHLLFYKKKVVHLFERYRIWYLGNWPDMYSRIYRVWCADWRLAP